MTPIDRPIFLDLTKLRFPIGAIASILHRVSGVLLALSLPFLVYALERSLDSDASYAALIDVAGSAPILVATSLLCWALAHHLLAGVRHLCMDAGIGASLRIARRTAWGVVGAGVLVALLLIGWLLK